MAGEEKEELGQRVIQFRFKYEQVYNVDFYVPEFHDAFCDVMGSTFKDGMYFNIRYRANHAYFFHQFKHPDPVLTKKIQESADEEEPVLAWWSAKTGDIFLCGEGSKGVANNSRLSGPVLYQSSQDFSIFYNNVVGVLKKRKAEDTSSTDPIPAYELFVSDRDASNNIAGITSISNVNIEDICENDVYLNPRQQSYSNLNVMELLRFEFEGASPHNFTTGTIYQEMKARADQDLFKRRISVAVRLLKVEFADWDDRISEAVAELVGWAHVIPPQYSFNEETRRIIVYVPCKHVALLLRRSIYVEIPLCVGPSPAVFHGSEIAEEEDENEDSDEPDSHLNVEIKIPPTAPAVLPQLSGQCNDIAFVPAETLQRCADLSGLGSKKAATRSKILASELKVSAEEPTLNQAVQTSTRVVKSVPGFVSYLGSAQLHNQHFRPFRKTARKIFGITRDASSALQDGRASAWSGCHYQYGQASAWSGCHNQYGQASAWSGCHCARDKQRVW
eukprot:gene10926-12748_t